ncbi:D-aminoacyl-tRNA deacylase [Peptoniphilus asaccharolyticus]
MRAVIQRVKKASVKVEENIIGQIGYGLLMLLGVEAEDTQEDFEYIYKKTTNLRIFDDDNGVMNLSIKDIQGEILVVSQFTLYGDARKGNRPSYIRAAKFDSGVKFYEEFIKRAQSESLKVATGEYGADMDVELINHGPVTILLDSRKEF